MADKGVILITGCTSGIGFATAQMLHKRGWRVFATGRRPDALVPLAQMGIETLTLDVTDNASIQAAIQAITAKTNNRIDALFNNAGYGQFGAIEDLTKAQMQDQFDTNVFGAMMVINAVLPIMRAQGHGRIVQNSSILGLVSRTFTGAYNASKYALEGFTDTLRLELKGTNIRVSMIEPGPIVSEFRRNGLTQALKVDTTHSPHKETYADYLAADKDPLPNKKRFPLMMGPEAVAKKVIHAIESPRPRIRYPVTLYAHLFGLLKRILPTAWLDRLLLAA